MHVHPDIAALRRDRAPQRHAQLGIQRALNGWLAEGPVVQMRAELASFGAGASLDNCPHLQRLFSASGAAQEMLASLSAHFCAALRDQPLGHPPFQSGFDGVLGSIRLARAGDAQIQLQTYEPGDRAPKAYRFSDCERYDYVLGGKAQARIVRLKEVGETICFDRQSVALEPDASFALDLACEALQVLSVRRRLVVLRLSRQRPDPNPSREYDAATGRLLHQSAGNLATSRQEAIIATLGRMKRGDAAEPISQIALARGDNSLRWQALRESLALDTAKGFAALCAIAGDPGDPLASSAGALRAQLIEMHPELAQLEDDKCRA